MPEALRQSRPQHLNLHSHRCRLQLQLRLCSGSGSGSNGVCQCADDAPTDATTGLQPKHRNPRRHIAAQLALQQLKMEQLREEATEARSREALTKALQSRLEALHT